MATNQQIAENVDILQLYRQVNYLQITTLESLVITKLRGYIKNAYNLKDLSNLESIKQYFSQNRLPISKELVDLCYKQITLVYFKNQELTSAMNACDIAIEIVSDKAYIFTLRSHIHKSLKNLDEEQADLNAALELEPTNAFALAAKGEFYRRQGNLNIAQANLNAAVQHGPNNVYILVVRSDLYRLRGKSIFALTDLNNALWRETK